MMFSRLKKLAALCIVFVGITCVSSVKAEVVTLHFNPEETLGVHHQYSPIYNGRSLGTEQMGLFAANVVDSVGGVQTQYFHCANAPIFASSALFSGTGQEFTAVSLMDIGNWILNDNQKTSIQTLYNHVYNPMIASMEHLVGVSQVDPGAYQLATQQAWSDFTVVQMALQFSLWEIIHEAEGNWDITSGNIRIANVAYLGNNAEYAWYPGLLGPAALHSEIIGLTSSWLDSINTGIWGDAYAEEYSYELTFYYTSPNYNLSQPLISVTGFSEQGPPVVPEPGTMLVFGAGLSGLGLGYRRKCNKS